MAVKRLNGPRCEGYRYLVGIKVKSASVMMSASESQEGGRNIYR